MKRLLLPLYLLLLSTSQGLSQEGAAAAPTIDSGNTAWIIVATALVLFMTIPGLSMFYAGLVRKKNVLSVFMHCFVITCVMSIVWLVFGYSAAFAEGGKFIGGMGKAMLSGIGTGDVYDSGHSIPELIFFAFQMTFFIITPALMVGAFVERIRFSAMLVFVTVWAILVYLPVCHMVWGGGSMLGLEGIMDHAGGIVVHITAGVGALVAVIVLGPRTGYPSHPMAPHNLPVCVAGTGMLWVGWFGFNAGSGLGADGNAAMTLIVTHISASTGALIWMVMEWFTVKKPSMLGIATGSIAGLAAITPASGAVGPIGALCIGGTSGFLCWLASTKIKQKFGYDDSLDVFGVHGVGGAVGTILVAVFAAASFGGNADADYSI
ncbi:MAG: ammonium transporter, partial [Verrucomicrobiaceae bacterium]|nr:ammonium transporter [Verrucomicrobiaceae bacterium]